MKSAITLALLLLLVACQGSPYDGPSRVQEDPEQAVINGDGHGGAVPMDDEIEDDENDIDQDPVIGAPER